MSRLAALRGRGWAPTLAVAVLVTLVAWPLRSLAPGANLDESWKVALHMAVHERLDPGTQVAFTYGPLGFLGQPLLAYPWTTRIAFLAYGLTQLALSTVVVLGLRRTSGSLLVAALGAYLAVSVIDVDPLAVIGFGLACAALSAAARPGRTATVLSALLGAVGGYTLLVKLNLGVTILALGVIVLLAGTARRGVRAVAWGLGVAGTFAAGWLAVGGSAGAIPDYLRRSLAIVSGYSDAMGYEDVARPWQLWAVVAIVAVGALAIGLGARAHGRRSTVALLLLWVVFAFGSFKAGFVRQAPGHAVLTFAALLGGLCAVPFRALGVLVAPVLLVGTLAATLVTADRSPQSLVRPVAQARTALDQAWLMRRGVQLRAQIAQSKLAVAGGYGMNAAALEALRGHGVHVNPSFTGAAWANDLQWDPLPVFQTYVAYTRLLDDVNAAALSGPDAPPRIASHGATGAIDQRNPDWESPAAIRVMLCHYRALSAVPGWQALVRVANRCGTPRAVRTVRAAWGQSVPIPAARPGEYLWVDVDGAGVQGVEKLRSLLLRAHERRVTLDGRRTYRVVPGTLADGLVLSVPRAADFIGEAALDQAARTIAVRRAGGASGRITLRFYAAAITR